MYFENMVASDSGRLRIVFNGAVVSREVAAGTTYGDIARMLAETGPRLHGDPIAIDLTLAELRWADKPLRHPPSFGSPTTPA